MNNFESIIGKPEIILSQDLIFIQEAMDLHDKVFGSQPEGSPYNRSGAGYN